MRKTMTLLAVCAFAGIAGAQMKVKPSPGGTSAPLTVAGPSAAEVAIEKVRRISDVDAMRFYKSGQAIFVDVRSNAQFALGHIKGALSIPGSQLVSRMKELPPGKLIIAYCA